MDSDRFQFNEDDVLHKLKHYLPTQSPLKDFIHHNTLHAFQDDLFHEALEKSATIFGYKVYLHLEEYRELYRDNKINSAIFHKAILSKKGAKNSEEWVHKLLYTRYSEDKSKRVGEIRKLWKEKRSINIAKETQTFLFSSISNFLDQGIAISEIPFPNDSFLFRIQKLDKQSWGGYFKSDLAKNLLHKNSLTIKELLDLVVGNEAYYEHYLFDQQFSHPGWSGMVAIIEAKPESLFKERKITLKEFIIFELLLEIDALETRFPDNWVSLGESISSDINPNLFAKVEAQELFEVYALWQEIMEWDYFDQIVDGLQKPTKKPAIENLSFQSIFCIDDRESSLRRHLERFDPNCETFATAGFFNFDIYYQPENSNFYSRNCPAPLQPKHIIQEKESNRIHKKELHFSKFNSGLFGGLVTSPTLGFWSAFKLTKSIFFPTKTPVMVSSYKHMGIDSTLSIEAEDDRKFVEGLQVGFTLEEMTDRFEAVLRQIGLIKDFAPFVYFVGHGASSVNNTHYAGYDCGACSGRPGSVNGRISAFVGNKPEVREILKERGIDIPDFVRFVGGLHDTTRDDITFYDIDKLTVEQKELHAKNAKVFTLALDDNSKERSRKFLLMNNKENSKKIHKKIRLRSLSLFEPRPEWNHATSCACIIGNRKTNKHLFFDRRAYFNSYDYTTDPKGELLVGVLSAAAPVCGGISLEYYFSRMDNSRLGAGSKLPHNVSGLIGVINGLDGDLRTGLPYQMVNIHKPLRLLVTIEQFPETVLSVLESNQAIFDWFLKEWIHLIVIQPETLEAFILQGTKFVRYETTQKVKNVVDLMPVFEQSREDLPVFKLN